MDKNEVKAKLKDAITVLSDACYETNSKFPDDMSYATMLVAVFQALCDDYPGFLREPPESPEFEAGLEGLLDSDAPLDAGMEEETT